LKTRCALFDTVAAEKIEVTKMPITRCFDEIEYLDIPVLAMKGKSRIITVPENIRDLWDNIQPIMRDPVITTFELRRY